MSTKPVSGELSGILAARASFLVQPWLLVVIAVISVQIGSALAKQLFDALGFGGVVFVRTLVGGVIFSVFARPRLRGYSRTVYWNILLYGVTITANMLTFYAAIERIPLGITVAIAFIGPLGVAVLGSRRARDIIWVAVAAIGILLLSPVTDVTLDPVGLLLALACGVLWGLYIVCTKRAGSLLEGNTMLALAMSVAAVVAAPFGAVSASVVLGSPALLSSALIVALLSSVVPFWLEFKALKSLPSGTFGLLVSLEPVAASVMGWLILHEHLGLQEIVGIGLVTIAAAATTRSTKRDEVVVPAPS